jgi:hypothetical protein
MKMAILFFYHHGSEGRDIFTIGKCGAKFKIIKCSKQTLSPFPQQSTLVPKNLIFGHGSSIDIFLEVGVNNFRAVGGQQLTPFFLVHISWELPGQQLPKWFSGVAQLRITLEPQQWVRSGAVIKFNGSAHS